MPFELIEPDPPPMDPRGEIELTGELVELADRLARDSAALAARYPASAREAPELVERTGGQRWHGAGRTLALLAAMPLVVALALSVWWPWHAGVEPPSSPAEGDVAERAVPADTPDIDGGRPATRPALFLDGLSAPELEGLLDLWESEGSARQSLSM